MKRTLLLILFCICLAISPFNPKVTASDNKVKELPDPEWVVDHRTGDLRKVNNLLFTIGDEYVISVLNDKTGAKSSEVDVINSTSVLSGHFGYLNQVTSQGVISVVTGHRKGSSKDLYYKLRAFNQKGKQVWTYTFTDKATNAAGAVGQYILDDGTLLIYLKLSASSYMTYNFTQQGKLIKKKKVSEFINDYQNGYFVTNKNWSGTGKEYKSTYSFYDSKFNLKFTQKVNGLFVEGVLRDGTVIYSDTNQQGLHILMAKDQKGKLLWKKTFKANKSYSRSELFTSDGKGYFFILNNTIHLFDKKGLVRKLTLGSDTAYSVTTSKEGTLMFLYDEKITFMDEKSMRRLATFSYDNSVYNEFYYLGDGILYQSTQSGERKLTKYKLSF